MKREKPVSYFEAAPVLRKIDYLLAGEGYSPIAEAKQPKQAFTHPVWARLYTHKDGGGVSLAFTDDDLRAAPTEIGLMVQARLAKARRDTV